MAFTSTTLGSLGNITPPGSALPGGPQLAGYNSLRDSSGQMAPGMQLQINPTANNLLRQQALSADVSPWTKLAMQNQGQALMGAKEQSAREAAQNNLQMSRQAGGPMSALNAMRNNMASQQSAVKSNQDQMMQLMLQDQKSKTGQLQQQVTNDLNAQKPQEFNITNAIQDKTQQDANRFSNWQEQMKGWAATEQARAQINAGKK